METRRNILTEAGFLKTVRQPIIYSGKSQLWRTAIVSDDGEGVLQRASFPICVRVLLRKGHDPHGHLEGEGVEMVDHRL